MRRSSLLATLVALALPAVAAAQLQVVATVPQLNAVAPAVTPIVVTFDRALDTSSVTIDTFRVFGRYSGAVRGTWTFSNGDKTATLTPDAPFSAGEMVYVNLSHDLTATDTTTLRSAGWAWQFDVATVPSAATFHETQEFSNRTSGQTRIYGAAASDFDDDGYLDLATVNEVSADVRVFLNHADGSNQFGPMRPPQEIGVEASPNETADFDNDGKTDMCVAAATSGTVSILLGAGNGSFSSATDITVGSEPHGIWPLDVDGDGDLDVVNCNVGSNNLSLMLNNGSGVFGAPSFFEGGVNGEYGLVAADMNADGITDLVVAGRNGSEINTMLGNGNGTFTASGAAQPTGGNTWVVVLGDVDGDGNLDAATANNGSGTVSVLKGLGTGRFGAPSTINIGAHTPAVDLGDLDGDGDPDMVVSSYGGGFWRWFRNDGTGAFTFVEEFDAVSNPSCAVLFDADNDGDLDLALSDEIADVVKKFLENENGGPASACTPTPSSCLAPIQAKKSSIQLKNKTPDTGDGLTWKWTKGAVTAKADFGNPVATDSYALCLYENGALVQGWDMPAGQMCGTKPCWRDIGKGFSYSDKDLTPDGIQSLKMTEGLLAGKAKITLKGKGTHLSLAGLDGLSGVLDVQLQKSSGGVCWGATFSPPFQKQDASQLKAVSDVAVVTTTTTSSTTTTTLAASFFVLHANTIGTTCGGCHGASGFGGLSGLDECHAAYAALVSIASTENPTMFRVTPGSPTTSWIMHKLDNTHTAFAAQCVGGFCGSSMPLGSPLLPIAFRDAFRQWITDGAVNDYCW